MITKRFWIAALAALASTPAGAATEEDYVRACVGNSNRGAELCTCIADTAKSRLTDSEFDFLVASEGGDTQKATELRGQMQPSEIVKASTFGMHATTECARGMAPQY